MIYEEEISIFTGIINYVHACRGCGDSDSKVSKDKDSRSVVSTDSKAVDSSIEDSEESTKPSGGDDEQTPSPYQMKLAAHGNARIQATSLIHLMTCP